MNHQLDFDYYCIKIEAPNLRTYCLWLFFQPKILSSIEVTPKDANLMS